MKSFKSYRTKAPKTLARAIAVKTGNGSYRSAAPFSLHGVKGEFV